MTHQTESLSGSQNPMLKIIVDVPITLRKKLTFIMAQEAVVEFSGSGFEDALLYLYDHEKDHAEVISPTGIWVVSRIRDITQEEGNRWLGQRHRY